MFVISFAAVFRLSSSGTVKNKIWGMLQDYDYRQRCIFNIFFISKRKRVVFLLYFAKFLK